MALDIYKSYDTPSQNKINYTAQIIHQFKAGNVNTLLNKSYIMPNPVMNNELSVFSGDETSKSVILQLKLYLSSQGTKGRLFSCVLMIFMRLEVQISFFMSLVKSFSRQNNYCFCYHY